MKVRLNVVKPTITPQISKVSRYAKTQTPKLETLSGKALKLRDFGGPDPGADDKDGYMAKHTLGGMAAGAATGAAIGSAVPVVGTAIGGLIGGLVGAMTGATVGLVKDIKKNSDKS